MHTIDDKLEQLRALYPKHAKTGQLFRVRGDTKGAWTHVTLYTVFVSDDGDFLFRPHVFKKQDAKSASEWAEWFKEHLEGIFLHGVLPGLARRTGLEIQWSVYRIVGWVSNVEPIATGAAVSRRRHKAKKKGGKNG